MKNTYYVVTHELNGKYYAEVLEVGVGENVMKFVKYNTIKCVTACETKKEAKNLSSFWNECFKKNNTYAIICNGKMYI